AADAGLVVAGVSGGEHGCVGAVAEAADHTGDAIRAVTGELDERTGSDAAPCRTTARPVLGRVEACTEVARNRRDVDGSAARVDLGLAARGPDALDVHTGDPSRSGTWRARLPCRRRGSCGRLPCRLRLGGESCLLGLPGHDGVVDAAHG